MNLSPRFVAVTLCTFGFGLALSVGCEPRHKPVAAAPTGTVATTATAPTATATTPATATATAPTPTATATTPATATAPTPTATAPTVGAWPTAIPGIDPNMVAEWAKKAGEMGLPGLPGAVPAAGGDPIEAAIKANAAKNAPGFTPASPIGRATLKTGEHAGMNFTMLQGKCYVVFGAGAAGVTQLGLNLLFPATPPNAAIASDTGNGANPVLGAGKPLCPPVQSAVRVDAVAMNGAGNVGVQVYVK